MQPYLTILLFADVEKDRALDRRWFGAVRELNPRAHGRIRVVVLNQRADGESLRELAAQQPYPAEVVDCEQPRDAAGYPVWDVVAAVRDVWRRIDTPYVTFSHTEYLTGPDRLAHTCDWLAWHQPDLAIGNLRRIATDLDGWQTRVNEMGDPLDQTVKLLVDQGEWQTLAAHWNLFGRAPWIFWEPEAEPGASGWKEDIFFAARDWLDALKFWDHGGMLPFQDVYDLLGAAMWKLNRLGLAPPCQRLDRSVHDACHLAHPKHWGTFTATMRQWFAGRREYDGTTFARDDLWDAALTPGALSQAVATGAVAAFRRDRGGTVTRWLADFSRYLNSLGLAESPIASYQIT